MLLSHKRVKCFDTCYAQMNPKAIMPGENRQAHSHKEGFTSGKSTDGRGCLLGQEKRISGGDTSTIGPLLGVMRGHWN